MTSESEQPEPFEFEVIEELTAYLDGELDDTAMQAVEQRLSTDTVYREELQSLQKTWDLLDAIPQTEPNASFTKTTMELVVSEAISQSRGQKRFNWIRLIRTALLILVPATLFVSAVWITRNSQSQDDRTLVNHLSTIDNQYRFNVFPNEIAFLEQLNQHGLFSGDSFIEQETIENDSVVTDNNHLVPVSSDDRERFIESLDVEKKVELQEKFNAFTNLSDKRRDQRVEFDQQIQSHPDREELIHSLHAYYDWFQDLDVSEKTDLKTRLDQNYSSYLEKGDPDYISKAILAICAIHSRQAQQVFGQTGATRLPSSDDVETVFWWYENVANSKAKELRKRFIDVAKSSDMGSSAMHRLKRYSEKAPMSKVVGFLMKSDSESIENLLLTPQDISILYQSLSREAQEDLDSLTAAQRRRLVFQWIESASLSQSEISRSRLKQFYASLPSKEKSRLDKMSIEDFQHALESRFRDQMKFRRGDAEDWQLFLDFRGSDKKSKNN